jgi:hypothetical protein
VTAGAVAAAGLVAGAFASVVRVATWYAVGRLVVREAHLADLAVTYVSLGAVAGAVARGAHWWLIPVWAGLTWVAAPLVTIGAISLVADKPVRVVARRVTGAGRRGAPR